MLACVANALSYVGLLYVWRGNLPRDHPTTIKRRIISTTLACSVAWLPVYFWATRVKPVRARGCSCLLAFRNCFLEPSNLLAQSHALLSLR